MITQSSHHTYVGVTVLTEPFDVGSRSDRTELMCHVFDHYVSVKNPRIVDLPGFLQHSCFSGKLRPDTSQVFVQEDPAVAVLGVVLFLHKTSSQHIVTDRFVGKLDDYRSCLPVPSPIHLGAKSMALDNGVTL